MTVAAKFSRSEGAPPFAFRAFGWGRTGEGAAMTVASAILARAATARKEAMPGGRWSGPLGTTPVGVQPRRDVDGNAIGIDEQEAPDPVLREVLRGSHHDGVAACGVVDGVDALGRSDVEIERVRARETCAGQHLRPGAGRRIEQDYVWP